MVFGKKQQLNFGLNFYQSAQWGLTLRPSSENTPLELLSSIQLTSFCFLQCFQYPDLVSRLIRSDTALLKSIKSSHAASHNTADQHVQTRTEHSLESSSRRSIQLSFSKSDFQPWAGVWRSTRKKRKMVLHCDCGILVK